MAMMARSRRPTTVTVVTPAKISVQSASVGPDNRLYIVASNDGGHNYNTWIYNGSGDSWTKVK